MSTLPMYDHRKKHRRSKILRREQNDSIIRVGEGQHRKQRNPLVFRLDNFQLGVTLALQRNKQMKQSFESNAVNNLSEVLNTFGNL